MRMIHSVIALLATACLSTGAFATDSENTVIGEVEMPTVQSSEAFNAVKKKLGKWTGQMTQSLTGDVFDVSYEWKLTSAGNTITETIIEDGVEMLTTYSDQDGELIVKHYCALGTEPIFKVSQTSEDVLALELDQGLSGLHAGHQSFVTAMKWTMAADDPNVMTFENTVSLDGEPTENRAVLKRSY